MTSHWCDPEWHDNLNVEADFLILALPGDRKRLIHLYNGFATCFTHVGKALDIMLKDVKTVTVHRVNT